MTRLGPWNPQSPEERLDRLESLAMIRQLPSRYALAVDSKDAETLVALFVPDVQVGRDQHGREPLKQWFEAVFQQHGASVHFVGDHIVSFDDADHARGVVYCHDELDHGTTWDKGKLQYWDTYVRVDAEWCFERRRFHRWYIGDALTRPAVGLGVEARGDALTTQLLPGAFENLDAFWRAASGARA